MKIHTLLFLIGTTLEPIAPSMASAQTCRIASGVNSEGYMTFKEVYEFDYVEEKPKFPGGGAGSPELYQRDATLSCGSIL